MKTHKVGNNLFKDSKMRNAGPGLEDRSKFCYFMKFFFWGGYLSLTLRGSERFPAWDRNSGGWPLISTSSVVSESLRLLRNRVRISRTQ